MSQFELIYTLIIILLDSFEILKKKKKKKKKIHKGLNFDKMLRNWELQHFTVRGTSWNLSNNKIKTNPQQEDHNSLALTSTYHALSDQTNNCRNNDCVLNRKSWPCHPYYLRHAKLTYNKDNLAPKTQNVLNFIHVLTYLAIYKKF